MSSSKPQDEAVKAAKKAKKDKRDKKDKQRNKSDESKIRVDDVPAGDISTESKKPKKDKKDKKSKNDEANGGDLKGKKSSKDKSSSQETKKRKREQDSANGSDEKTAKSTNEDVVPAPAAVDDETAKKFFDEHSITMGVPDGIETRAPLLDMKSVPVQSAIVEVLSQFPKPTPIQSATWPYLLAGEDVVGVAETGSGKTLAFGVPAIHKISSEKLPGISALVVSPTRELAMQIYDNLQLVTGSTNIKVTSVYGGVPKYDQQRELKSTNIVVGTPGRLKDLISDGSLPLDKVKYVVLDEADRMLEKGFEEDIKQIIGQVSSSDRQVVMFTATWPQEVRELAGSFMKPKVVKVSVGDADELTANKRITQIVEVVGPRDKTDRFLALMRKYTAEDAKQKILVFALYKKETARVERLLQSKGYQVAAIHGDLNQTQRTQALADFKAGKRSIMLATDVAARGLDIPNVKVVLNLTFPLTVEDYVHRIGRTGRAGKTGTAHTLFTEEEKHLAGALGNVLRGANQPVPDELLKFGSHTKKKEHSLYGAFFKNVDPTQKAKKIKFD